MEVRLQLKWAGDAPNVPAKWRDFGKPITINLAQHAPPPPPSGTMNGAGRSKNSSQDDSGSPGSSSERLPVCHPQAPPLNRAQQDSVDGGGGDSGSTELNRTHVSCHTPLCLVWEAQFRNQPCTITVQVRALPSA